MTFKAWCEQHSIVAPDIRGRSWENVRKLLAVGKAEDPQQALTDMREGNKAAVKRHRESGSAAPSTPSDPATAAPTGPTETAFAKVESALGAMRDEEAAHTIRAAAETRGLRVVSADHVSTIDPTGHDAMTKVKAVISQFTPAERLSLAGWLTDQIEADITSQEVVSPQTGGTDNAGLPPGLDRRDGSESA